MTRIHSYARAAIAAAAVPLALGGCAARSVERIDAATVTDLSGRWNDVDSRIVAEALTTQSLHSWAAPRSDQPGPNAPVVIVGAFRNRTYEHIAMETFIRDLERALITSGGVRVVASRDERVEVREERADQQENAAPETRARLGRELGAKYILQGDVTAIEDREGRDRIRFYQIDATLIDLESNAKIWTGQHKIKKHIEHGWFSR